MLAVPLGAGAGWRRRRGEGELAVAYGDLEVLARARAQQLPVRLAGLAVVVEDGRVDVTSPICRLARWAILVAMSEAVICW